MEQPRPQSPSPAQPRPPAEAPRHPGKRLHPRQGGGGKKRKSKREKNITEGSSEEVLRYDIDALLASLAEAAADPTSDPTSDPASDPSSALPELGSEIDVQIRELSSTGDGLGTLVADSPPPYVFVVPFSVPGDVVRARVYRHVPAESHSLADFLSVVAPSPLRDDSRARCRYFASCSGCQFQMLDYAEQLRLKRRVVERAFARFSGLDSAHVPEVGDTVGSPLQYGYRTKLTPHFQPPPDYVTRRRGGGSGGDGFAECPPVGFMFKGRRKVLDIEDCPIGTDVVRKGLTAERGRMRAEYGKYKRGATILLRESTQRIQKSADGSTPDNAPSGEEEENVAVATVRAEADGHVDVKTCVTDHKALSTEYVSDHVFVNPAGSFFQNNNSILPGFTDYVRSHILPPAGGARIRYLIDAYSGSGLFTITLSSLFEGSVGIDIDPASIASATRNAAANGIPAAQARFVAADAAELFLGVAYPADETVVVLDPPRKGCDEGFLAQLLRFGPRRVVYVSCNVHTQARDVGFLVRGDHVSDGGRRDTRYEIESLRGFDFFPQTAHVEGVAVLNRVDEAKAQ